MNKCEKCISNKSWCSECIDNPEVQRILASLPKKSCFMSYKPEAELRSYIKAWLKL